MFNRLVSAMTDAMRFVAYTSALAFKRRPKINILEDEETVRLLRDKGYSLARFGDGEFQWMANRHEVSGFQQSSYQLSESLKEAFYSNIDKLIIGIPRALVSDEGYNLHAKSFWRGFVVRNHDLLASLLDSNNTRYANASITRPYIDYSDKTEAPARFELVKSIWNGRDLLIIEGASTGFGIGNDLLDNAAHVRRLEAPPMDAFARYDDILSTALQAARPDCLILLCLGPTASVLAYDFAKAGYQAIDIGHFDLEYEWFLRGAKSKDQIPGKHVNENKDSRFERVPIPDDEIVSIID